MRPRLCHGRRRAAYTPCWPNVLELNLVQREEQGENKKAHNIPSPRVWCPRTVTKLESKKPPEHNRMTNVVQDTITKTKTAVWSPPKSHHIPTKQNYSTSCRISTPQSVPVPVADCRDRMCSLYQGLSIYQALTGHKEQLDVAASALLPLLLLLKLLLLKNHFSSSYQQHLHCVAVRYYNYTTGLSAASFQSVDSLSTTS